MNSVNHSWYENGKPYREYQVVKGLPNSKFVEYHPDSRLAEKYTFETPGEVATCVLYLPTATSVRRPPARVTTNF